MMRVVTPVTTPTRLHLKKNDRLEIDWADGHQCVYTLPYLRSMCRTQNSFAVDRSQGRRYKQLSHFRPGQNIPVGPSEASWSVPLPVDALLRSWNCSLSSASSPS